MASVKAPVLGKTTKVTLPDSIFTEEFHEALVYEAARADMAARRQGSASTLGRGEVSMTGAKAWRQKGTGRARIGALSAPHRYGGGAAFGPTPRNYTFKVNRKARRRALRSALALHAERDSIAVVKVADFKKPSTKDAAAALAKWGASGSVLVVLAAEEETVLLSFRNLPKVSVLPASAVGVADIVGHASVVISEAALEIIESRSGEVKRGTPRASDEVAGGTDKGAQESEPASDGSGSEAEQPADVSGEAEQPAAVADEAEQPADVSDSTEESE